MTNTTDSQLGAAGVPRTDSAAAVDSSPHWVLEVLLRHYGRGKTGELADALGVTRQTIRNRRLGRADMTVSDLRATASALEVPVELFLQHPREALRWLADHKMDELLGDESEDPPPANTSPIGDFACNAPYAA
jgi:hypothetical protein